MRYSKTFIPFLFFLLSLETFAQPVTSYGDNAAVGKFIVLNGVQHYYEVYGSGKPMLLIHGNGTGIKGWSAQIAYFSKNHTVYAVDNRGRGKSELGKDSLTYLQQTKDLAEFIRLMHMDSVDVVGKSDGGIIGILLGIYYPQHIDKIVAFGANMCPDSTALFSQAVESIKHERHIADSMLLAHNQSKNWKLEQQKYRMMEFQPNISAQDLHKIKVPVLVMSCDRDLIKEEHTLFIYKNIPRANLCILNGETHHVARENPELFNTTVDKFISRPFKGNEARF